MEGELEELTEEQIVARQRVNKVLQRFDKVAFRLTYFFYEGGPIKRQNIAPHLFSALKNCERHGNYNAFFAIWKFLAKYQLCSKEFDWKLIVNFLEKDGIGNLPLLSEAIKVMWPFQTRYRDEAYLVNTVFLLKKEMYEKAQEEASKFTGKQISNPTNFEITKAASSDLLMGYKTMLDYQFVEPDDKEALAVMRESFDQLLSNDTCVPLFVETYVCVLMRLKLQEEAEMILRKYVEKESQGTITTIAAVHALNIMKLHMPKASLGIIISFLELIAERNSGDEKVLELCQHYLHVHNSGVNCQSDTESDFDFGSDYGAVTFAHKREGLSKCLELIVYFLDVHIYNVPSTAIREGWSIMADTMRRICMQGTDDCLRTVVDLWHNDRKRWWPCFRLPHSGLRSKLPPGDAEFLSNKGFVCYVLESHHHPFVATLREHPECKLLKSLVKQLSHHKVIFDSKIEPILKSNGPIAPIPLISSPDVPRVPRIQSQMVPSLPKFEAIDTMEKAKEFTNYILTTAPLKERGEYKTLAKPMKDTVGILDLQINDLLAKRYEKRRKITVQSRFLRMTRSSRSAALSAGDSVCSLDSLDSRDSYLDLSENETDDSDVASNRSSPINTEDDDILDFPELNPCLLAKIEAAKERWRVFLNSVQWNPLSDDEISDRAYVDLPSDDDYAPSFCSDDSDFGIGENQADESETDGRSEIHYDSSVYLASEDDSEASSSAASSFSSVSTPVLQFSNVASQPKEVIRNEDRYNFMEFDSFSVRSNSTTDGIADSINRVIKKLDIDVYCANTDMKPSGMAQEEDEYVVEEEIEIPREALAQRTSQNYNATSGIQLNSDACVLEGNTDRRELSFGSNLNRSFSRDFEASSPDMFASCSEDEEEKFDSVVQQRKVPSQRSLPFSSPLPIAGSTPKQVHKAKSTNDSNSPQLERLQPKKKMLTKTREKSSLNSSSPGNGKRNTTKTKNRKSSKLSEWKVSEESTQEESRTLQKVLLSTSSSKRLSTPGSATHTKASRIHSDITNPEVEATPEAVVTTGRKKKRQTGNAKRMESTSALQEKSMSEMNRVTDVETIELSLLSAQEPSEHQPKNSRIKSISRKCHTRVRDPNFLSDSDNESGVSASISLLSKKNKNKSTDAVSVEGNTKSKYSSDNLSAKKTQSTGKKSKTANSIKTTSNEEKELPSSNELNSSDSISAEALIEKILAESKSFISMVTPDTEKPKAKVTRRKLSADSRPPKKAKISEEPIDVALSVEEILLKYLGDDSMEDKLEDTTAKKRSKSKPKPLGESSAMDKTSSPKKSKKVNKSKENRSKTKSLVNGDNDVPTPDTAIKTSAIAKKKSGKKMTSAARESFSEEFDPLSFVEELLQESHGASRNSIAPTSPPEGKPVKRQKASVPKSKSVVKRPSNQRKTLL
ncbi:uncharacterized protein LOC130702341 [Daphnia carinata]|uniref:uncharacterized protein LOC130702341 n=1 Tax=Daphnia carinata TaxID=120202 RepID=UPI00257E943D|nr:uncharacterized protein LOC130702341 [Daphnia carinata]